MPCPNDHRERSVTVGFRMTPEQKRWLDRVAEESGMSKQDFIMARLHDEAITVGQTSGFTGRCGSTWWSYCGS